MCTLTHRPPAEWQHVCPKPLSPRVFDSPFLKAIIQVLFRGNSGGGWPWRGWKTVQSLWHWGPSRRDWTFGSSIKSSKDLKECVHVAGRWVIWVHGGEAICIEFSLMSFSTTGPQHSSACLKKTCLPIDEFIWKLLHYDSVIECGWCSTDSSWMNEY